MSFESLLYVCVGLLAYAISAAIDIELPDGRRGSLAAAFGPGVVALGTQSFESSATGTLFAGLIAVELVVVVLLQRRPLKACLHVGALVVSLSLVLGSGRVGSSLGVSQRLSMAIAVAGGSWIYYAVDVLQVARRQSSGWRRQLVGLRGGFALGIVVMSTAGLIVLVFPYLGWFSFAVMFLPVLAARHEFGRYREAHRTYRETVGALAGLTEGAGYVAAGHHARVARLCVEIAQELGLPPQTTRELELVGLLHDVGAVSLPDASDVRHVDPEVVATNSARILEETGHLARYAPVVVAAADERADVCQEARILRVADVFDGLSGPHSERLRKLTGRFGGEEREVIDALVRVIERRSTST